MADPVTVLLVDDHAMVRQGMRAYLESDQGFVIVGEAPSGQEAVRIAAEQIPDVVVMDLIMPGMDGVEATRQVRRVSPRSKVIVLTSYHDDEYIFPAMEAGATSYILKDIDLAEVAEAIRKTAQGDVTLHPRIAARIIQELQGVRNEEVNPYSELTQREMEVLKLLANGRSNHEIAQELVISGHTVKGHVSNILSKLHLVDRTQAAVYAWKKGIVQRDRKNP